MVGGVNHGKVYCTHVDFIRQHTDIAIWGGGLAMSAPLMFRGTATGGLTLRFWRRRASGKVKYRPESVACAILCSANSVKSFCGVPGKLLQK